MNSDVAEIEEMDGTFRHEFGHYLDTAGVLPVPRSKRRMRNVYVSSSAARRLRDDHDAMLDAGRGARGAGETAEDLYRHLGVDLEEAVNGDIFEMQFADAVLKSHGGDEAAALLAIKKHEKRIGEWLKSRGVDFPYGEFLEYAGIGEVRHRGWAAAELAVHLARGGTARGVVEVLKIAEEAAGLARNAAKQRALQRLRDFVGNLTDEKYAHLRGGDYYRHGQPLLFKTEVGEIRALHLAEAFANYMDLRYDPDAQGRVRFKIAQLLFPATTRRLGEILEEIGNGDHPINSGRDYAAENNLGAARKQKKAR